MVHQRDISRWVDKSKERGKGIQGRIDSDVHFSIDDSEDEGGSDEELYAEGELAAGEQVPVDAPVDTETGEEDETSEDSERE